MAAKNSTQIELKEEIRFEPVTDGSKVDLNPLLAQLKDDGTLILSEGAYDLSKTVDIKKPVKIVGQGKGKTIIRGSAIKKLVSSVLSQDLFLQGISFHGERKVSLCISIGLGNGKFNLQDCSITNDKGFGVFISGATSFEVKESEFLNIRYAGLMVSDKSTGFVRTCTFENMFTGINISKKSMVNVTGCTFGPINHGVRYEDKSSGRCSENEFREISGVSCVSSDKATPIIENNK